MWEIDDSSDVIPDGFLPVVHVESYIWYQVASKRLAQAKARKMADTGRSSRRGLLVGAVALGAVAWGWQRFVVTPASFDYAQIPGLPGWRKLAFEGVSTTAGNAANVALIGIDDGTPPIEPLPIEQLCDVLFDNNDGGKVAVAAFSDFFCPYCRRLTARLTARVKDPASKIALTWHELPLLGPSSEIAARAGIAADLQNGYPAFQDRLMRSNFRPSPAYLADIAASTGLDPDRLLRDMDGAIVADRLRQSRAAAETLGIFGTPALVVERTLVMGEASDTTLDRVIADADSAC